MKSNKYKKMSFPRLPVRRGLGNLPLVNSLIKEEKQLYFMQKVEDPRTLRAAKPSGMTSNLMGFTLIELLVVVLIIGILSAVALPQYTLAVNKTRFSNLRNVATAFINASEAYYLANNEWPNNFDELAIDLPGGFTPSTVNTHSCGQNEKMYCCMIRDSGRSPAINCGDNDYTFSFYSMHTNAFGSSTSQRYNFCVAKEDNEKAKQLCKAVTNQNGTLIGWSLLTPNGNKGGTQGYRWYVL